MNSDAKKTKSNYSNDNCKSNHKTKMRGDNKPKLLELLHAEEPDLEISKTLTTKLADAMLNSDDKSKGSDKISLTKTNYGSPSLWENINKTITKQGPLGFNNFKVIKELGSGDIGSVFLVELKGSPGSYFAMKVMDKVALASRKKIGRTHTEKDILQKLDHPFLPSLYSHFETKKHSSLVMEFCSGGDLHTLRQKQPGKRFPESAARFYAAEVLLSLEYLHMMGIIYRDLKPENILIREDGHIMVSDFDLSMQCTVKPKLVRSASVSTEHVCSTPDRAKDQACLDPVPSCMQPSCSMPTLVRSLTSKKSRKPKQEQGHQVTPLPELLAEPTGAHSLSFVGTYEYLAPEIIKGDGHGSAVDWWTFGIFLYELLHGKTPFKGKDNKETLTNVIGNPLTFPTTQTISIAAQDLIRGLLEKNPEHRFAHKRGATEIKQHPFFKGFNWALIRHMAPPQIPKQLKPPDNSNDDDDDESDFSFF